MRERVREAFALFEHKEGSMAIAKSDVASIVRSLGYNISEAQASQLLQVRPVEAAAPPVCCVLERTQRERSNDSNTPWCAACRAASCANVPPPHTHTHAHAHTSTRPCAHNLNTQRIPPADDATAGQGLLTLEQCAGTVAAYLVDERAALARDDYHTLLRAFR